MLLESSSRVPRIKVVCFTFLSSRCFFRREGFLITMKVPFEQRHELFSFTATSPASPSPSSGTNPSSSARIGNLVLPVVHQDNDNSLRLVDPARKEDLQTYLKGDLDVDGLNKVHKHLWLAGLPQCARPLFHQLVIDRKVILTE